MNGFKDIHAHFLYGIDDGAKTKQDMMAMLDAAYMDGTRTLFATPHMVPGIEPFDQALYNHRLEEAREHCYATGCGMQLCSGAEVLYTPAIDPYVRDHRLQTLADSEFVLVEFVPDIRYQELEEAAELFTENGYIPIFAHIERYRALNARTASRLKADYDVRYQLNANSLLESRGLLRDLCITQWLQNELIDFVATDMHDRKYRPTKMQDAYRVLCRKYSKAYADYLVGVE